MAQCEGPRALMLTFFGLHPYLAGRCCEIPQVPGAPRNVNSVEVSRLVGVTNTWLVGVTIYSTTLQSQFTSTSPVFTQKILLKKKLAGGNAY